MTDESSTGKKEEHGKIDPAPAGETKPLKPPSPSVIGGIPQEGIASRPGDEKPKDKCDKSKEILVRVVEDDTLSAFESKTLFWGRAGIVLAVVTLAVGIATLIVFYCQLNLMQTQLQDAESDGRTASRHARQQIEALQGQITAIQKQMRQDQRAWIQIDFGKTIDQGKNGVVKIYTQVTIRNTGKTAARKISGKITLVKLPNGQSPSFHYGPTSQGITAGSLWQGSGIPTFMASLKRLNPATKQSEVWELSIPEYREIDEGKAYIATYGELWYADAFDVQHWTRACVFSPGPVPIVGAEKCTDYNAVDSN